MKVSIRNTQNCKEDKKMTVKQIEKEIRSHNKEIDSYRKNRAELVKENAPQHLIDYQDKWIAYHEKQLNRYREMLPEAERIEEEKMLKKIAKQQLKDKASTIGYINLGNGDIKGITPEGKNWYGDHNWYGNTDRTLHCYTLRIEGLGVLFTSGTLERVLTTVAQH